MKHQLLTFLVTLVCAAGNVDAAIDNYLPQPPNHNLRVTLHPEQHTIEAQDTITLPRGSPDTLKFSLHRGLSPTSIDAEIKLIGKMRELWQYSVTPRPGHDTFTVEYRGEIYTPPQQEAREARAFQSTSGIISEEGVVLSGDSGWYPNISLPQSDGMLTFTVEVKLPLYWSSISQGERIKDNQWRERQPQSEIHLIAGIFKEYTDVKSNPKIMVFMRNPDADLAQRYLETGTRYINMYQKLIAPYPYTKFALVENFWETGYGMPSFTLLGSQVIRLPFIVDTSYPHEILHNWWGNGVLVDYEKGNWSEGLTSYLADHLLQEKKGEGAEYRRATLQRYADFISAGRDFPLSQFTSRNSAQSEAVGYGKAMMLFHMLRREMDDDRYLLALQNFYKVYQFKRASFADMEQFFTEAAGKPLMAFSKQWFYQTGAPQLHLVSAQAAPVKDGYELVIHVEQTQRGAAYTLDVPVVVTLAGEEEAYSTTINMQDKQAELRLPFKSQPLRVDIDPEFDLFRRLENGEMPATFSQVLGAQKLTIILPHKAPIASRTQYLNVVQAWQQQPDRTLVIKWDDDLDALPDEGAVWLFGWENKFLNTFQHALDAKVARITDMGIEIGNREYDHELDTLALAGRINQTPVAWMATSNAEAIPVLARKMPHYAKFSYAVFDSVVSMEMPNKEVAPPKRPWLDRSARPSTSPPRYVSPIASGQGGPEIRNREKGIWPLGQSPLVMAVRQADGSQTLYTRGKLPERNSLVR